MIKCDFINIEDTEPDLIISFGCLGEAYDQKNDILIQRVPVYEAFLNEEERGALLSVGYSSDERNVLKLIEVDEKNKTVLFKGGTVNEVRDCSRIDDATFQEMSSFFARLNFDNSFQIIKA